MPWADMEANPNLCEWLDRTGVNGDGTRALVVGCGLGDDAEELAQRGFQVTAFDLSSTAISWCHRRFPKSTVAYRAADLFSPPPSWKNAFDFVLESYTLQSLPGEQRLGAIECIVEFLAPGGTLLVITRARDPSDDPGEMPWPLTSADLEPFVRPGLREVRFEDFLDREEPPVRRFRVEYRRDG